MASAAKTTKKTPKADTAAASVSSGLDKGGQGKKLKGVVVKTAMVGTITVKVDRFVKHPKYKKYYSIGKKYLVDDKAGLGKMGDVVEIVETRPISKLKRFRILSVVEKAKGVNLADVDADAVTA